MLEIRWSEHITNEEVFLKVGETRSFLRILKIRREKKLVGHILSHNNLLSRIIEGT